MIKGKVAVVTGGGRGLGRAIATVFAEAGVKVAVVARTRSELERTVSAIADRGGQAMAVKANVADSGDMANLARAVEMKFGPADILVNNAGIIGPPGLLKDIAEAEMHACMDINFFGMFLAARAFIPGMVRKRYGRIINVTSGFAETVMPRLGAYSISKAAVNHFTRILAQEMEEHNVYAYGLDPGAADTSMQDTLRGMDMHTLGPEAYSAFRSLKETGRLKKPEASARLALFLASYQYPDMNGEIGGEEHFSRWGFREAA